MDAHNERIENECLRVEQTALHNEGNLCDITEVLSWFARQLRSNVEKALADMDNVDNHFLQKI